jgi:hypothetical protein
VKAHELEKTPRLYADDVVPKASERAIAHREGICDVGGSTPSTVGRIEQQLQSLLVSSGIVQCQPEAMVCKLDPVGSEGAIAQPCDQIVAWLSGSSCQDR